MQWGVRQAASRHPLKVEIAGSNPAHPVDVGIVAQQDKSASFLNLIARVRVPPVP